MKQHGEQRAKEAQETARKQQAQEQAQARAAADAFRNELAEAARKQQAEALTAELARRAEQIRLQQRRGNNPQTGYSHNFHPNHTHNRARQAHKAACDHAEWWDKVHGRAPCPECDDVWNYLLECPGCGIQACPKCQRDFRPYFYENTARVG
jgi:hypothetical protein